MNPAIPMLPWGAASVPCSAAMAVLSSECQSVSSSPAMMLKLSYYYMHRQAALERQDLSCTYLARHQLEGICMIIVIIMNVLKPAQKYSTPSCPWFLQALEHLVRLTRTVHMTNE